MVLSSLQAVYSRWLSASVPLPALSSRWIFAIVPLPADAQQRRPGWSAAPPQRPGQSAAPPQRPYQQLRRSAPASNKPHPAKKSTPVWLAIWHIWAGFANSQLLHDAAALSSMQGLPRSGNSSAQTSASLHPPAALRLRVLPFTRTWSSTVCAEEFPTPLEMSLHALHLLRHSKSLGPSAPIAYATSVSPPDEATAWPGRRCWVANNAAGCPWRSSCKSPRTLQKCKLLITRQLTCGAVLGEHYLSSPSTRLKVNQLCIRYLCFKSVRGDLQEGHFYASRCHVSLCSSTKTSILCSKVPDWARPK